MKLTALNTAIRKNDGPPRIDLRFNIDTPEQIELYGLEVTKQSLLASLKAAFPDGGRSTETGLYLREDGYLRREADRPVATDDDDLDMLGGSADGDEAEDMLG